MEFLFTKTPLAFFVQDLWRDEAFSVIMAEQSILEILRTTVADFSPPLYYIVLHFWMLLFGTSEVAIRSLSLFLFTLTLFILFEIMVLVFRFSFRKALLYFVLIIVNPFLLFYAFEARMYMMVTFFITLSYFALWTKRKRLYVVAMTLALYSHYFAVFIFVAQVLSYLLSSPVRHRIQKICSSRSELGAIVSRILHGKSPFKHATIITHPLSQFFIPILLFAPWALYLIFSHDFSDSSFWIIMPPLTDILYLPFVLYTGYERVFGQYYHGQAGYTDMHHYLNWLLLGVFAMGMVSYRFYGKTQKLFQNKYLTSILIWSFFPPLILFLLSQVSTPLYHPRYFIFSSVGFILLLVISIEYIAPFISSKLWKLPPQHRHLSILISCVLTGYLLFITNEFNTLNLRYHSKRHIAPLYEEIAALKKPGDLIYLTSELDFHLAQYYIGREDIYIYGKQYAEIPSYVGNVLIPKEVVVNRLPLYPAKAFIVSYDSYEIVTGM